MSHFAARLSGIARALIPVVLAAAAVAPVRAGSSDTFVHLFEWSWADIAKECKDFLGPKGYAAVQISPPNEHIQGDAWWTRYQPVSYKIVSRSGNEAAFKDMVDTCHAAGVKIYADAVINHTADQIRGAGVGGSVYARKDHPAIPFGPADYHPDCTIDDSDYRSNPADVYACELGKLPDLNTAKPEVQDRIAAYLRDLTDRLKIDGLRIDAAKHMAPADLKDIMGKAGNPWAFLEVIGTPGESVQPGQYVDIDLVSDFKYGTDIAGKFRGDFNGSLSQLRTLGDSWGLVPSNRSVVFIDNHDRERGHGGGGNLTYKDGARYDLATVFMLAHPQGYPSVLSGYRFTNTDAGPPAGGGCTNPDWVCQHRRDSTANMVGYRRFVVSSCPGQGQSPVDHWWTNGSNQIAFGCADKGFVVINNQPGALSERLKTGLPAGRYCNVLSAADPCGGEILTVDAQGFADFNVAGMKAAAIHGGARPQTQPPDGFARTFPSLSFRGTPNNWSVTPMALVADHVWELGVRFDGRDGQRFKFDRKGDWSLNYGDNQGDGTLDPTGRDIYTAVSGDYRVRVDDRSLRYELISVAPPPDEFASSFESLYFRGTPNGWGKTPMKLVADHVWEAEVTFDGRPNQRFKLDVKGDWTHNYGDNDGDRRLDRTGKDIPTPVVGIYRVRANDRTLGYELIQATTPDQPVGNPKVDTLGALYNPEGTTFSLWCPDRTDVKLVLGGETYPMRRGPDFKGYTDVYQVTVAGDQRLKPYRFLVDGVAVRDPYGRMAEPNGDSIVMDMSRTELPGGWSARPPLPEREDAVIYELHVRDFTIDPSSGVPADRRGKFLGLAQRGTTHKGKSTGLDHLVELGITHAQLLPIYDFGSCPNVADTQCYNWGYDPRNYNVPDERYSLTPSDYENRAREFKQTVDALHQAGIRVVIDVVYNHTFDKSMFDPITGRYYTPTDLSGTGNSLDADQPMVGRMIRDSLEYWVREYNIDGFRFDLIGIFDYDEVGEWGRYLNTTFPDRNLLIYGEPWNGFAPDPRESHRVRLGTIARIADAHVGVFNPKYREAIKGTNDSGGCNPGDCYAFNTNPDTWRIRVGSRGSIRTANDPTVVIDTWDPMFATDPEQSINYVSAHDNLTLRDKILLWADTHGRPRTDPYLRRTQEFANGIILVSQGIPFLHSGEELLRDKQGNHNSYDAGDGVNAIRWDWKVDNADIVNYYKQAIALRRAHPGLRLNTWDEIDRLVTTETPRQGVLINRIRAGENGDGWSEILVVMNSGADYNYTLPSGTWRVAMERSDPAAGQGRPVTGSVVAQGTAVTVLYRD